MRTRGPEPKTTHGSVFSDSSAMMQLATPSIPSSSCLAGLPGAVTSFTITSHEAEADRAGVETTRLETSVILRFPSSRGDPIWLVQQLSVDRLASIGLDRVRYACRTHRPPPPSCEFLDHRGQHTQRPLARTLCPT